ncbi:Tat pathway signal protein [Streptomyces iranensis]|uniref:Tetratricopeptide (TPR) repeat protein n=1 Tax=Streptomyces iranensis TaxID=576784 RepID=A0ABS4MZM5_9ACTN|nr:Tat pathway signal protein [Streptomyces iranensis]MBP2065205.1 tetratricopeptide (TPR) repeat protein [Streptomyces iranensis]
MARTRNEALAAWMAEHKVTTTELAERLNSVIAEFTGSYGTCTERGVFRWLSGEIAWPHARQRIALERVTGHTPVQLGFQPRGRPTGPIPASPEEDPLYRRAFLTAAVAGAPTTPFLGPPRRVGMSDVDRLQIKLDKLIVADHQQGSSPALEAEALIYAQRALDLQEAGTASQRVRGHLYRLAASFTNTAMWAAIDARDPARARPQFERTLALAGLSGDGAVQHRTWLRGSILAGQLGREAEATAAMDAARSASINRRNPLVTSLSHAHAGTLAAYQGDRRTALRYLDHAHDALTRAEREQPRPLWVHTYDQAELEGLTAIARLQLGDAVEAEAHAHRALSLLGPGLHRNRALYTVQLALAQLAQGDLELAVTSAAAVPSEIARQGRVRNLLRDFSHRLNAAAPNTREARAWHDHNEATT